MARPSERGGYKYGICTNRDKDGEGKNCPKCESKEVQKVRGTQEFVCEECKEPLRQVPPPKEGPNMKMIGGIIAAVVVLGGGAAAFVLLGGDKAPKDPDPIETPAPKPADTTTVAPVQPEEKVAEEPKEVEQPVVTPQPKTDSNAIVTKDLGYATYKGRMKNGLMNDDNGILTFKTTHIIESRDVKQREAKAGERVVGVFEDGHLTTGTWYKSDGNKELIIP